MKFYFKLKAANSSSDVEGAIIDPGGSASFKMDRFDLIVAFILGLFIFIPNTDSLAGGIFQIEEFYHWNACAVSAALAYLKGGVLYGDFIPQYGVGWPVLLATLHPVFSLTYAHVINFAMLFAIAYYYSVFLFLRTLGFNRILSFAATFFCVTILILPGAEPESKSIIWRWGGGAPMRSPLDMVFFSTLFLHLRDPRHRSASLLGALAGFNLLFSIDGGLFLMATMVSTWGFLMFFTKQRHAFRTSLCSIAVALGVLFAGLSIATRGTLFSQQFVSVVLAPIFHWGKKY